MPKSVLRGDGTTASNYPPVRNHKLTRGKHPVRRYPCINLRVSLCRARNGVIEITVNIKSDYRGTGGGAAAGPDNGLYVNYSTVRADLINNATAGDTTFNALPGGSSIQGQTNVAVWNAQLKLWGVLGANDTTTDDGSATFATDINPNLLVGVALHELTHAMGRVPYGTAPDIFDLFRFTSPGVHLFSGASTAPSAYFSLYGVNTKLADYGRTSDPSDFLNSG